VRIPCNLTKETLRWEYCLFTPSLHAYLGMCRDLEVYPLSNARLITWRPLPLFFIPVCLYSVVTVVYNHRLLRPLLPLHIRAQVVARDSASSYARCMACTFHKSVHSAYLSHYLSVPAQRPCKCIIPGYDAAWQRVLINLVLRNSPLRDKMVTSRIAHADLIPPAMVNAVPSVANQPTRSRIRYTSKPARPPERGRIDAGRQADLGNGVTGRHGTPRSFRGPFR
jgi:hypothetical protein